DPSARSDALDEVGERLGTGTDSLLGHHHRAQLAPDRLLVPAGGVGRGELELRPDALDRHLEDSCRQAQDPALLLYKSEERRSAGPGAADGAEAGGDSRLLPAGIDQCRCGGPRALADNE